MFFKKLNMRATYSCSPPFVAARVTLVSRVPAILPVIPQAVPASELADDAAPVGDCAHLVADQTRRGVHP